MDKEKAVQTSNYTCNDYRMEMRLLGMRQQLAKGELSQEEKEKLKSEIDRLEQEIGMS